MLSECPVEKKNEIKKKKKKWAEEATVGCFVIVSGPVPYFFFPDTHVLEQDGERDTNCMPGTTQHPDLLNHGHFLALGGTLYDAQHTQADNTLSSCSPQ